MNELTWKDIMDGSGIDNPAEQQAFFLSRFFNVTVETLNGMSMEKIYPMMAELDIYLKDMENGGHNMLKAGFAPDQSSPNYREKIENRFQILDFGDDIES